MSANDELAARIEADDVIFSDRVITAAHLAAVTVRPDSRGGAEYWRIRAAVCWALHSALPDERGTEISQPVAPPRPAGIPWVPIADMPEAWKDGREVLLWCRNTEAMHVAWWEVRFMWAGWVRWGDDRPFFNPTHVAAINPPEGL